MTTIDPTKDILLPYYIIRNKKINGYTSLLYGDIISSCDSLGYIKIDIGERATASGLTKNSVKVAIKKLQKQKLIEVIPFDILKEILNKDFTGLGIGNKICEWCNIKTYVIHEHHFPISKHKGGTEKVFICPNCHNEFHYAGANTLIIRLILTEEELKNLNNEKQKHYEKK